VYNYYPNIAVLRLRLSRFKSTLQLPALYALESEPGTAHFAPPRAATLARRPKHLHIQRPLFTTFVFVRRHPEQLDSTLLFTLTLQVAMCQP
jgi:hypothetical protein